MPSRCPFRLYRIAARPRSAHAVTMAARRIMSGEDDENAPRSPVGCGVRRRRAAADFVVATIRSSPIASRRARSADVFTASPGVSTPARPDPAHLPPLLLSPPAVVAAVVPARHSATSASATEVKW